MCSYESKQTKSAMCCVQNKMPKIVVTQSWR